MKLSFFASAVRPHLWQKLIDSLKGNTTPFEIVFAGFIDPAITVKFPDIKYIKTENIKPAQCYEVARRNCTGELVCWIDDDHTFSEGFVDKVYEYWRSLKNERAVVAVNYVETGTEETIENYRFFARNLNTPQLGLCGVMNRTYLDTLGGLDARYIIGRWHADIQMRVLADRGKIEVFKGATATLNSKNKNGLYNNFWSGWNEDSEILENSWVIGGYKRFSDPLLVLERNKQPYYYVPICNREVTLKRNDEFVPYPDKELYEVSHAPVGIWFPKWGASQ